MSDIDEISDLVHRLNNSLSLNEEISVQSQLVNNSNTMATPQISVRDYMDLIPRFDGDPSQLSAFLNSCDTVLSLMAPDNDANRLRFTLLHIRTKIVGRASQILAARTYRTFPDLKTILISVFGDQRNEESLLSDLNLIRQKGNETCLQFADRCIDLRCLLLNKVECSDLNREMKNLKIQMYNSSALRAYLTGLNSHMSHLLRCKSPKSLEEAIQFTAEEENIDYHRAQLRPNNPQSSQSYNQNNNSKLQIKKPPIRVQPIFIPNNASNSNTPFSNRQQFVQQTNRPNWTNTFHPRPYIQRQSQNVFAPHNAPVPQNKPTPMDISGTTRSYKPPQKIFKPAQQQQQRKRMFEELHAQEDQINDNEFDDAYQYQENIDYSDYPEYLNFTEPEITETELIDENFQIDASESIEEPIEINTSSNSRLPYIIIPEINAKFMIDSGSTKTLINEEIALEHFSDIVELDPFQIKTPHNISEHGILLKSIFQKYLNVLIFYTNITYLILIQIMMV